MQDHATASPFDQLETRTGVLVADGWGIRIHVHQGHLVVEDGRGSVRRTRRLNRATHGLKRVIVLGHSGFVTFEAVRWLTDAGVCLIQIDQDGRILATTASPCLDHPALRRAQALAATGPVGIEISRSILRDKLTGQETVTATISGPEAGAQVAAFLPQLEAATSLEEMRLAEALAANAYFETWAPVPVRFATADRHRIPEHWLQVGPRRSPLSGRPRFAANPANALRGYLYRLLEAESRLACLAVGLDPGIGILHADERNRDSLALDVMEAIRPDVDAYLLRLLRTHVFRASDFCETPRGICRVLRPLSHELAETSPTWAARVAPIAEQVARQLTDTIGPTTHVTPLPTRAERGIGSAKRGPHLAPVATLIPPVPTPRCQECGVALDRPGKRCTGCDLRFRTDRDHPRLAALDTLRAEGRDPAHGGQAGRKRSAVMSRRNQETLAWDREQERPDPDVFRRDILPGLRERSIPELMLATGLSHTYCAMIRRGAYTPHPRHWPALREVDSAAARPPVPPAIPVFQEEGLPGEG